LPHLRRRARGPRQRPLPLPPLCPPPSGNDDPHLLLLLLPLQAPGSRGAARAAHHCSATATAARRGDHVPHLRSGCGAAGPRQPRGRARPGAAAAAGGARGGSAGEQAAGLAGCRQRLQLQPNLSWTPAAGYTPPGALHRPLLLQTGHLGWQPWAASGDTPAPGREQSDHKWLRNSYWPVAASEAAPQQQPRAPAAAAACRTPPPRWTTQSGWCSSCRSRSSSRRCRCVCAAVRPGPPRLGAWGPGVAGVRGSTSEICPPHSPNPTAAGVWHARARKAAPAAWPR
jgi:hypothetical protein